MILLKIKILLFNYTKDVSYTQQRNIRLVYFLEYH